MTYILIEPLFSGKLSWPGKGKPAVPFGDLYDGIETLDVWFRYEAACSGRSWWNKNVSFLKWGQLVN